MNDYGSKNILRNAKKEVAKGCATPSESIDNKGKYVKYFLYLL